MEPKEIRSFELPLAREVREDLIDDLAEDLAYMYSDEGWYDRAVYGVHETGLRNLTDAELVDEWRSMNEDDELGVEVLGEPAALEEKSNLVLSAKELAAIVAAALQLRAGETLTEAVISDRANNIAQGLIGVYIRED